MDRGPRKGAEILSERREVLDELAHLLTEKEVVEGEELRKMLAEYGLGKAAKGA